jgi:DNA-binding HxlR family transcriptional regulator
MIFLFAIKIPLYLFNTKYNMYSKLFIVDSFSMDTMDEDCTVYKTVDFISKKWSIIVLLELYRGNRKAKRYSEIKESLKEITPKVLSARLKELEQEGLISKKVDASQFPVKCEYSLTSSGMDFIGIIQTIKQWAIRWKQHQKACEQANCLYCEL